MEFYWDFMLEYVTNAIINILNNKGFRHYTEQDNGKTMRQTSNSIVQAIKYDRSYLLSLAKYRKLSGFSNDDMKRIKLLDLK